MISSTRTVGRFHFGRLQRRAAIDRDEQARFRARIEDVRVLQVLRDRLDHFALEIAVERLQVWPKSLLA